METSRIDGVRPADADSRHAGVEDHLARSVDLRAEGRALQSLAVLQDERGSNGGLAGLGGPPSTPSMRDLSVWVSVAGGASQARRGARRAGARGGVGAAVVAAPRRVGRRARAGFEDAGASRAQSIPLITKLVRRAAARGRARVEHGAAAAGLHPLRCALRLSPATRV